MSTSLQVAFIWIALKSSSVEKKLRAESLMIAELMEKSAGYLRVGSVAVDDQEP